MSKKKNKIKNYINYNTGCLTKVRYPNLRSAQNACVQLENKHPGQSFNPYLCKFCGSILDKSGYHVGHAKYQREL